MSNLIATYDGIQHCTVVQEAKGKAVSSDACTAGGGKGEELSPAELVGSGLASCMLSTMGMAARMNNLDISGTIVEVEVILTDKPVSSECLGTGNQFSPSVINSCRDTRRALL